MPDSIGGRAPFSSGSSREVRSEDDAGAKSLPGDLRGQGSLQISPDAPLIVVSLASAHGGVAVALCPVLCKAAIRPSHAVCISRIAHRDALPFSNGAAAACAFFGSARRQATTCGGRGQGCSSTEPLAPIGNLVYVPERENASHATTSPTPFRSFPNRAVSSQGSKTYIDRIVMHHHQISS